MQPTYPLGCIDFLLGCFSNLSRLGQPLGFSFLFFVTFSVLKTSTLVLVSSFFMDILLQYAVLCQICSIQLLYECPLSTIHRTKFSSSLLWPAYLVHTFVMLSQRSGSMPYFIVSYKNSRALSLFG